MDNNYNSADRVFSAEAFAQFNRLNQNTNNRIPIFFCVDVSGSMGEHVGIFQTRIALLTKVMRRLLENMKTHPVLSERAVIGVITYNNKAILSHSALDVDTVDIVKATEFQIGGQTIFSKGLRRALQAIDQYRDSVRRSDVDTCVPILVFMTDGFPVGDDYSDIADVYNQIWERVKNNDLYVFPIGISRQANMDYVKSLTPSNQAYQIINEEDFSKVFSQIEALVNDKPNLSAEETMMSTKKASVEKDTLDTGSGTTIDPDDLSKAIETIIERH